MYTRVRTPLAPDLPAHPPILDPAAWEDFPVFRRIPTPLAWKRRNFAIFEPCGMIDRLYAVAVSGIVAGPFAIYSLP